MNLIKRIKSFFEKRNSNYSKNYAEGLIAYDKGIAFYKDNKKAEALIYFDKAIDCEIKDAYNDRAWCLESLHYDYEAIDDFTKAIEISPYDCNLYFGRGLAKRRSMDYEGAVKDAEFAVEYSKIQDNDFEWRTRQALEKGYNSLSMFYYSYLESWKTDANNYYERMDKIKKAKEINTEESIQSIQGLLRINELYESRSKRR